MPAAAVAAKWKATVATKKPPAPPAPYDGDPKAKAARKRRLAENRTITAELRATQAAFLAHQQRMEDLNEELRTLVALLEKHIAAHPKVQDFIAAALRRAADRNAARGEAGEDGA